MLSSQRLLTEIMELLRRLHTPLLFLQDDIASKFVYLLVLFDDYVSTEEC